MEIVLIWQIVDLYIVFESTLCVCGKQAKRFDIVMYF